MKRERPSVHFSILSNTVGNSNYMMPKEFLPLMNCKDCQYQDNKEDGCHCYMFKDKPEGDRCGQFKAK